MKMNRRARRRTTRAARRNAYARRPRRRLSLPARATLALLGTGLALGAIILTVHGGSSRAGRLLGVGILLGIALVAMAWRGVA